LKYLTEENQDGSRQLRDLPIEKRLIIGLKTAYDIAFLHNARIIHGDIKSENFMSYIINTVLGEDITIKAVDFDLGLVLPADKTSIVSRAVGTRSYMAPEVIEHGQYSFASDVFAFGMMIQEGFGIPIAELIPNILHQDPVERPSIHQVMEVLVKIFKEYEDSYNELDDKAHELINICEKHLQAQKETGKTTLTIKQQRILEVIASTVKQLLQDPKLDVELKKTMVQLMNKNPDLAAATVKGYLSYLSSQIDIDPAEKKHFLEEIQKIEAVSTYAKFLDGASCEEIYQALYTDDFNSRLKKILAPVPAPRPVLFQAPQATPPREQPHRTVTPTPMPRSRKNLE
jgi:serine/threonine protein kinase